MIPRRALLNLAGVSVVVGAAYGIPALLRRLAEPDLVFDPIAGLPGFRRIAGGPVSGGASVLLGIGDAVDTAPAVPKIGDAAVCDALFGAARDLSRVQIAYFTDYRCVYCRQVSPMLAEMAQARDIEISWHDLPLLGQSSTIAAHAAVAARAQGAYDLFHHQLMGSPALPTPPFLRQLAADAGIDPERLLQDMRAAETRRQLQTSAALANRFGFIGTPALVIGRTAVLGGVERRIAERLIAAEKAESAPRPCGS